MLFQQSRNLSCLQKETNWYRSSFLEVHTQNRLSILAACEDPETVATYNYSGDVWPLPQTGQMWLEYELLKNPEAPGFFCLSTSYRAEPNPVPGRHETIFPMFEFEFKGDVNKLKEMEEELIKALGLGSHVVAKDYSDWCTEFDTNELTNEHESLMEDIYGPSMIIYGPNVKHI